MRTLKNNQYVLRLWQLLPLWIRSRDMSQQYGFIIVVNERDVADSGSTIYN